MEKKEGRQKLNRNERETSPTPANEEEVLFVMGSGDVFADIGLKLSPEDYLKTEIARAITQTINKKKLTQVKAAEIAGEDQSKISAITRGQFKGLSVVRMIKILASLGRDVQLQFGREYRDVPGKISVCG